VPTSRKLSPARRKPNLKVRLLPGGSLLQHAIEYLACEARLAQTREEHENFSIALKLLGLLLQGWRPAPSLFDVACGYVVGLPSAKYVRRKAARVAFQRRDFLRAIPDYDYSVETSLNDDPTDGRRHSGNQFLRLAIARGSAGRLASHRGRTPKRISSNAQLERNRPTLLGDAVYFGA
jgi:hypothetical protein